MAGLESVLDGWKHDPNEAGLGGGTQIPCHGAECGFCLFDHRSAANKNNKSQRKSTLDNREIHASITIACQKQQLSTQNNRSQHFRCAATRFLRTTTAYISTKQGYWNIKECVTGGPGTASKFLLQTDLWCGIYLYHGDTLLPQWRGGRRCLYEVLGSRDDLSQNAPR